MVQYAKEHGNKPATRAFGTSAKTIRKWRSRYEKGGYNALNDLSRAPKNPYRKIQPSMREKVIKLKRRPILPDEL